jgi:hypothetical protein
MARQAIGRRVRGLREFWPFLVLGGLGIAGFVWAMAGLWW